jgi:hypothetical protein
MEERAFYYAVAGGKAKDDPYFKDFFRPADFVDMSQEEITEDDLENLKHAQKYLAGK